MRGRIGVLQSLKKSTPETKLASRLFGSSVSGNPPANRIAALWGNGDFGRLGLGGVESHSRPTVCSALVNENLRDIACGGAHTLFLTESGRVYATGLNDFGQLGVSKEKSYTAEPLKVCGLPNEVAYISAGYYHSSAITVDGKLFMWGKNSNGQLGLGKRAPKVVSEPCQVDSLDGMTITMSALGGEHSVAVTEEGEVLSWGNGTLGKLGHDYESSFWGFKSRSEYTPRLITKLAGAKVKNIAAGLLHTACIDENGSVFVFGEGLNKFASIEQMPSMVAELPVSGEIACGGYHICAVTNGGQLYIWGSNESGCLGPGESSNLPRRVEGPFLRLPVCKVSCGWKHTTALAGGNLYAWGWGGANGAFSDDGLSSGGQLGQGDDSDHELPALVHFGRGLKPFKVSCGFNHTAALLQST